MEIVIFGPIMAKKDHIQKGRCGGQWPFCAAKGFQKGEGPLRIDTHWLVSMTEANQNFSRVARLVNQNGSALILKNNHPRYLVLDFQKLGEAVELPADAASDTQFSIVIKGKGEFQDGKV